MTADYLLVIGTILTVLSGVSVLSAWIDGHSPRVASIVAVIGLGMLLWGTTITPGGLRWDRIPRAFVAVIGRMLN